MRITLFSRLAVCALAGLLCTEHLTAQITMRSGTTGGGKEYLNILAPQSATNIDTLWTRVSGLMVESDTLFERTDSLRADVDTLYARVAANEIDWTNIAEPVINFTNALGVIDFANDTIRHNIEEWMLYVNDNLRMYTEDHAEWIVQDDLIIGSNDDDYYWDTEVDVKDGSDSLDIYIVFDAENDYTADFDVIPAALGGGLIDGDEMQIISEDDILIQAGQSDGNDISIEMVSLANAMALNAGTIYASGRFKMSDAVMPTGEPSSPVQGSFYFKSSHGELRIYNGSAWVSIPVVP
jgi:hypothetical protein